MTAPAPTPAPRRDKFGVPWCRSSCPFIINNLDRYRCALDGERIVRLYGEALSHCQPQLRLDYARDGADAAELAVLRAKYETEVVRERRKTDEWSARIVEATEKALVLATERDAAQAEVERLRAELDASETELRIKKESLAEACKEVERLRLIEARAQAIRDECLRAARMSPLVYRRYAVAVTILHDTGTPGDAPEVST